jgi:hypothetical protein
MSYTKITALAVMAILQSIGHAFSAEPAPLFVHHEVLKQTPSNCHDMVKLTFVQFHALSPLQDFDFFQFGVVPGGSIAAYCLPRPNIANETWLVIAVASTTSGGAQELRDNFLHQTLGNRPQ